jgi:hypothetical protein
VRALTWAEILSSLPDDARRAYWKSLDTWHLLFLAEPGEN